MKEVNDLTLSETQYVIIDAVESGFDAEIRGPFDFWTDLANVSREEADKPQWSVVIFPLDTSKDEY